MRITTRISWDMESGAVLEHQWYEYGGEVELLKGDNSKAEMAAADAQRAQENQLMQQQLKMQMDQIAQVNGVLDPIIRAGGMTPQEEAAMTSIGINQLPQDFRQTEGALNERLAARGVSGGQMAGGGEVGRQFGQLGAMEDYMKSGVLTNVQLQKANLLRQALGAKMGVAGMFGNNVGGFNQGALSALGIGQKAAESADAAATSWMGPVFGGLGALGGGWASGGFKTPCWVARAVYGEDSPLWVVARNRFYEKAEGSRWTRLMLALYIAVGEPLAWFVERSETLKRIFRRLFDKHLLGVSG